MRRFYMRRRFFFGGYGMIEIGNKEEFVRCYVCIIEEHVIRHKKRRKSSEVFDDRSVYMFGGMCSAI